MKFCTYICFLSLLLFPHLSQASVSKLVHENLASKLSCKDRQIEKLCYLSLDQRGNDLVIFLSSALYRMEKFNDKRSFIEAASLANEVYRTTNSLVREITPSGESGFTLVVAMEVIFSGDRVTVIHDSNETALVDMDERIDIYHLLEKQREQINQSTEKEKERKSLNKGQILTAKYEVTNTYNIASAAAEKNNETGEVKHLSDFEKTGQRVTHTKTTHYLVWFPLGA